MRVHTWRDTHPAVIATVRQALSWDEAMEIVVRMFFEDVDHQAVLLALLRLTLGLGPADEAL